MLMGMIKIWYDKDGDFLEITFRDVKGYLREVAEDIYERVDGMGNPVGFAILNFSRHERESLHVPVEWHRLMGVVGMLSTDSCQRIRGTDYTD
jgi:uncharacterized protein YuzE